MPLSPSSFVLGFLQKQQSDAMDDLCNIRRVTFVTGSFSDDETQTYTIVSGVPCGIMFNNGRFRLMRNNDQVLLLDYDVMLRLPASRAISIGDEVELVEKGTYNISGTFQLSSQPTVNSSVQHVPLKRLAV